MVKGAYINYVSFNCLQYFQTHLCYLFNFCPFVCLFVCLESYFFGRDFFNVFFKFNFYMFCAAIFVCFPLFSNAFAALFFLFAHPTRLHLRLHTQYSRSYGFEVIRIGVDVFDLADMMQHRQLLHHPLAGQNL